MVVEEQHPSSEGSDFECSRLVLIVPTEGTIEGTSAWISGPAPFNSAGVTADARARATYFDERIERALYGRVCPELG